MAITLTWAIEGFILSCTRHASGDLSWIFRNMTVGYVQR